MARHVVYDLERLHVAEYNAICSRGWQVDGISSVSSSGGETREELPDTVARQEWMQLRRQVMVYDRALPPWGGMIDTPWGARLPARVTIYPPEYILSLRTPDVQEMLLGDVYSIAAQMIERFNAQGDWYIRPGDFAGVDVSRQETLDTRSFWEQLNALVLRAGKEMFFRPVDEQGQMMIYIDIKDRIGEDTDFLLHDGEGANIEVGDVMLKGKIVNRLIGTGSQSAASSRIRVGPLTMQASADLYGVASGVKQFQNVVDETTLGSNTANELAVSSWAWLEIPIKILDVGRTFEQVRVGNSYLLQIGKSLALPGGVVMDHYRGPARLMTLALNDDDRSVGGSMEVAYVPVE
jgi:hypothetical protein